MGICENILLVRIIRLTPFTIVSNISAIFKGQAHIGVSGLQYYV